MYHRVSAITNTILTRRTGLSVMCWALYIAYELFVIYYSTGTIGNITRYMTYYAVNLAFFYTNASLMHHVFDRHRPYYLRGILLYLLLVFLTMVLKSGIDILLADRTHTLAGRVAIARTYIPINFLRTVYFSILSVFYWSAGHIGYFRSQAYQARNAYLQQQVNPHLLFNTLNYIYNDVVRNSPETAECVLLLSDMMRYSLEATEQTEKLPLAQEIGQLENLIHIHAYRYSDTIHVNFTVTGEPGDVKVSPLILLTIAENVFKHGYLKDSGVPALITLEILPSGEIRFRTVNAKRPKSLFSRRKSLGLANVRTRLDYTYPGRHRLDIQEDEKMFYLNLIIQP